MTEVQPIVRRAPRPFCRERRQAENGVKGIDPVSQLGRGDTEERLSSGRCQTCTPRWHPERVVSEARVWVPRTKAPSDTGASASS